MPLIEIHTPIRCPPERAFDLSRDVSLHEQSTRQTRERAVAGRTEGLAELGDEITWEATHFGFRQRLTVRITAFDQPHHFRDSMVQGAFARFDHDHIFHREGEQTLMIDRFDYTSPLGPLGRIADLLFLRRYMESFLRRRCEFIRREAEATG